MFTFDDVRRLDDHFFCDRFQLLPRHRLDFPISLLRFGFELRIVERLHQGFPQHCQTVGRQAPNSLYRPDLATFEEGDAYYRQQDAEGFIRLNALRLKLQALRKKERKES